MLTISYDSDDEAWYLTCGQILIAGSMDRGIIERLAFDIAHHHLTDSKQSIEEIQEATGMSKELARQVYIELAATKMGVDLQ